MAIKSFAYAAWHYHVYSGNLRKFYRLLIEVAAAKAIKPTITNAKFSWHLQQIRCAHQIPRPVPKPNSPRRQANPTIKREPSYEITFTCTPCGHRSSHSITKQGYHCGSVLIACPGCKNRHIISDHLDIFGNRKITVEDLLKEKGQLVKKGTLSEDGDLEFWADGSITSHTRNQPSLVPNSKEDNMEEGLVTKSSFKKDKDRHGPENYKISTKAE